MPYIFLKMLNMSITAGWMILAAILLRLVLKRAPKAIRYILWALVAVRLILPVSFESVTSLIPSTEPVPQTIYNYAPGTVPELQTGFEQFNSYVNPIIEETYVDAAVEEATVSPYESFIDVATVIWICGSAVMLVYCIASYAALRRKVRASAKLRDRIYICDGIGSPFILGIIRPRIYMPSSITDEQMAAVEAHERMHIRHGDHLWKVLGFLILSAYWWNPLIWAAYILFCRDIELICDEAVVKKMEVSDRTAYSEALLSFNMPRRLVSACPLAFGEVGVKSRIKSVLSYKKPTLWIMIVALIACTVTAVCLLTDPLDKEDAPFEYDRIAVRVFGDDGEDEHITFESLDVGSSYILPGYGDVDKVVCTVESADPEKKVVTLRFDNPLCRVNGGSQTDTISLLLDHLAYEGLGNDSVTLKAPDESGIMYNFAHVMVKGAGEVDPVTDAPEERPIDKYINLGRLPEEAIYSDEAVSVTVRGMIRHSVDMLYCNKDDNNALKFYEALDVGAFTESDQDIPSELNSFVLKFRNDPVSIGEYTVYEDDTVVCGSKDGEDKILCFKAAEGTFQRLVELEDKLNQPDSIRKISAYDPGDIKAYVYGKLNSTRNKYSNAAEFYETLDTDSFVQIELNAEPELEYFRVLFNSSSDGYSLGDYTVYEDDTVKYYLKRANGDSVFFKASEGTYDRLVALEDKINTPEEEPDSEPALITSIRESTDSFLVDMDGDKMSDVANIRFSEEFNCYTLMVSISTSSSGLPAYIYVLSDLKNYKLWADNTDVYNPKLVVEHDGKKIYYTVGPGLTFTNDEGRNDLILFNRSYATGFLNDNDMATDSAWLSPGSISGVYAFSLKVNESKTGVYSITIIPDSLYKLSLETDVNNTLKLKAQKDGNEYLIGIKVDGGKIEFDGAPEDFGEAYIYNSLTIPTDAIDKEHVNIDGNGSNIMDTVFITDGPISGRYSFNITAKCDKFNFSSTYAYDMNCELDLVRDKEKIIQLKATKPDGSVSVYDIKCEHVGFRLILTCVEGENIFEEIYTVTESDDFDIFSMYSSESADVDGDGYAEVVSIGPGWYSGLRSFSITIQDGDEVIGPVSFVSDSISQTLVKGEDGKLRLRAEYEYEVIFYDILPGSGGILADKNGIGVR